MDEKRLTEEEIVEREAEEMEKAIQEEEEENSRERMLRLERQEKAGVIEFLTENGFSNDETTTSLWKILDELRQLEGKEDDVSKKREKQLMETYSQLSKKKWQ